MILQRCTHRANDNAKAHSITAVGVASTLNIYLIRCSRSFFDSAPLIHSSVQHKAHAQAHTPTAANMKRRREEEKKKTLTEEKADWNCAPFTHFYLVILVMREWFRKSVARFHKSIWFIQFFFSVFFLVRSSFGHFILSWTWTISCNK